ncbi:MAG: hypothetical protein JW917_06265 [Ignavibacteria bacterium]|nr:hypothetical protein [Ignavibacteria bacterium]
MKKTTKISRKLSKPKTKKDKNIIENLSEEPVFCTECGKELDNFWQDKRADHPDTVRRNHERCVKTGKFNGIYCSKLFIISSDDIDDAWLGND